MEAAVTSLLWAVTPGLLTGVVLAIFSSRTSKANKRREQLERNRHIEAKLNLDLTFASAQLAYASAVALKRGYANGEVEQGVKAYEKAIKAYREFEREQMADIKDVQVW